MPVAAIAMIPAPENCQNGIAAIHATAMQLHIGVCRPGETLARNLEPGSWLSRAMPKHSLIVAAMIDRQQTKTAADTTSRELVANGVEKLASMMAAGPNAPFTASPMFGMATSTPSRNTPPMMNAPITEYSTALGAARRGSRVSSASVAAVSNP